MKASRLFVLFLLFSSSDCVAAGLDGSVVWSKIGPHLEFANDQVWNVKALPAGRGGLKRDEVRFVRILSLPDSLRILQA